MDVRFHDIADAWHLAALLGLLSPAAATITDGCAALLIVAAFHAGRYRHAATLTAAQAASSATTYLLTHH